MGIIRTTAFTTITTFQYLNMQIKCKTNKFVAKVAKIVKKMYSPPKYEQLEAFVDTPEHSEDDNAANEALEAKIMEIIASAPESYNGPVLVKIIPACPDKVCRHLNITLQTGFQVAGPQAQ